MKSFHWTILYILTIVGVNVGYSNSDQIMVDMFGGSYELDIWGVFFGTVFVTRDLAQKELGKTKVLFAMAIAALLSLIMADPAVAVASVAAFITAELIDWAWFTFGVGSIRNRILTSSVVSSPIDAFVFLIVIDALNPVNLAVASISKLIGILIAWFILPHLKIKALEEEPSPTQP